MVNGVFPRGMPYGGRLPHSPRWHLAERLYDGDGALRLKRAQNGDMLRFVGEKGSEYQMQYESEARDVYCTFMRIRDENVEIFREMKVDGWKMHFTDHRPGGWRRVRCVQAASGRHAYYEGPLGKERLVMKITPKGNFYYYEGERKHERLVRIWYPARELPSQKRALDYLAFYEGEPKKERLVRTQWANGDVVNFEGEHDEERKLTRVFASGTVQHYRGARGQEYMVREVKANGLLMTFDGAKGHERKVREDHPHGTIKLFTGTRHNEYMTTEICFDPLDGCSVSQFEPVAPVRAGGAHRRRILLPSGTMLLYPGPAEAPNEHGVESATHPRRMISPEGHLHKRRAGQGWKRVHEDDDSGSMGWEQRKRFKNAAGEMWAELEQLSEAGGVNENALIAMGAHFKHLNAVLD